jgi:hypothetical protein
MYWPKFSMKKLAKLIRRRTPSGASCTYIKWTQYVGLKTYTDREERDQSVKLQRRAAKIGLAPKAGASFEFEITAIGYDCGCSAPEFSLQKIYCYWTEHAPMGRSAGYRAVDRLDRELSKIGIEHTDLYDRNLGRIRGKLVCIDFDPASCSPIGRAA